MSGREMLWEFRDRKDNYGLFWKEEILEKVGFELFFGR